MNEGKYRVCTTCIMDTSDPYISFNSRGECNHCEEFRNITIKNWNPNEKGKQILAQTVANIKRGGQGNEYDCIIGLSGGVDSSYLALKVYELGLRPLVVHVDGGWNSELAIANIESVVKYCGYDLHTHVIDWEEMKDLQVAYLKSGVSNQDVPQDHAFFASLYHFATKNKIKYILSGGNIATEAIFPRSWHGDAMDAISLKAIHKKYGTRKLKSYSIIGFFDYFVWYPFIKGLRTIRPLNYMPYVRSEAIKELEEKTGWRSYGRKHGESLFTKFFQNHYLPERFGYDKRRPHFSSMIASGQLKREDALKMLDEPLYDKEELNADIRFFCQKLQLSPSEFEMLMTVPTKKHSEYPNHEKLYRTIKMLQQSVERVLGRKVKVYS